MSYYFQGIGVYHIYMVLEFFLIYRVSDRPMLYRVSISFVLFTGYKAVSYIQGISAHHIYRVSLRLKCFYSISLLIIFTGYKVMSYIQGIIARRMYLQGHMYLQYISINHIYRVSMRHALLAYSALPLRCRCRCRCSAATSSFCEFYRL